MFKIDADRIYLRRWSDGDAEALYGMAKDPAVGTPAGWPAHESVEMSLAVIRTVFSAPETYAIVLKDTDKPIGCVGVVPDGAVHSEVIKPDDAEVGYWLGRHYWGKGYATEATAAIIGRLSNDLKKKSLWISIYEGNERSRRVSEKCGFEYDHSETDINGVTMHFYRR